jgi:hypothetical protein
VCTGSVCEDGVFFVGVAMDEVLELGAVKVGVVLEVELMLTMCAAGVLQLFAAVCNAIGT